MTTVLAYICAALVVVIVFAVYAILNQRDEVADLTADLKDAAAEATAAAERATGAETAARKLIAERDEARIDLEEAQRQLANARHELTALSLAQEPTDARRWSRARVDARIAQLETEWKRRAGS